MHPILLFFLICAFALTGCSRRTAPTPPPAAAQTVEAEPVGAFASPPEKKTPYTLFVKKNDYTPAPYEPSDGCYTGAYILSDKSVQFNIAEFERLTKTKHVLYRYHMKLSDPFPLEWILDCISKSATPYIVIEPDSSDRPFDTEALENAVKNFRAFNIPMFVQFYPARNSYNAKNYTAFFQHAHALFAENAPSAAIVWSVPADTVYGCMEYYPGDEYVDWAGLGIYQPLRDGGAYDDGKLAALDYFYYSFQSKKPIIISEFAVSHFSSADHAYHTLSAAQEISDFYAMLPEEYPRVKGIIYMDFNGLEVDSTKEVRDNFTITTEPDILSVYVKNLTDSRFLKRLSDPAPEQRYKELYKSPFTVWAIGDEFYLCGKSYENDLGIKGLNNTDAEKTIDGETHYSLRRIMSGNKYELKIDPKNRVIVYDW